MSFKSGAKGRGNDRQRRWGLCLDEVMQCM